MATVRVKSGHVQPVWAGHPWVFAQAIERVEGGATPGDEVDVVDPKGNVLGRGLYSPRSAIPVRIVSRRAGEVLDAAFFRHRLERAIATRRALGLPSQDTTAYRLVHAEGDNLPGLIVDRFDDVLAVQFLTVGMKLREGMLLDILGDLLRPRAIVDRTPVATAKLEGFEAARGVVRGEAVTAFGFYERGLRFRVPLELAHKTGFYFDQRPLRARVEELARGRRVLDTYCFVAPFALAAARGGAAEVLGVDESAIALEVAAECARDNDLTGRVQFAREDARLTLRRAAEGRGFDVVILDPPRLAPTRSSRENALGAYARLAELGCRATESGGYLVFCSCSSAVDLGALTRALGSGAARAGRIATVLERHFQGPDHPVSAAFPEGLYLKALVARIDDR